MAAFLRTWRPNVAHSGQSSSGRSTSMDGMANSAPQRTPGSSSFQSEPPSTRDPNVNALSEAESLARSTFYYQGQGQPGRRGGSVVMPMPMPMSRRTSEPASHALLRREAAISSSLPNVFEQEDGGEGGLGIPSYEAATGRGGMPGGMSDTGTWDDGRWMGDYLNPTAGYGHDEDTVESPGETEQADEFEVEMSGIDTANDPLLPRGRPIAERWLTGNGRTSYIGDAIADDRAPRNDSLPPAYTSEAGRDELRVVSSAHLSPSHPASAFFSALALSPNGEDPPPPPPVAGHDPGIRAGGKKLCMVIRSGGRRMNANGTGPIYIRLGRGGVVTGTVMVGDIDRVIGVEIAIVGYVKTSYYIRGQYNLIDTITLVRSPMSLFPPSPQDHPASTTETRKTKDGQPIMEPGSEFQFEMKMPRNHWSSENVELPPTCEILQLGLQATVEYVLKIRVVRKGQWRLNEELSVPIVYEPRAYITPRRLRALTMDDPLNPGWRTLRMYGGVHKLKPDTISPIEVSLIVPSPFILFMNPGETPCNIPFHLHFYYPSGGLPLKTFSDPRLSNFIVKFQRVTTMKVAGLEEIRKSEIATKVELWEDGKEVMVLDELERDKRPVKSGGSEPGGAGASPAREKRRKSFSFSDTRASLLRRKSSSQNAFSPPTVVPADKGVPRTTTSPDDSSSSITDLGKTDIHLNGLVRFHCPTASSKNMLPRKMVQSCHTPDISVAYVMQVGVQPNTGAVRETFEHVWGGGIVEVVWGR